MSWFAYEVVTFCQDKVSGPGVSTQRVPKISSWLAMAASWDDTCALLSIWIEYEGTSKHGRGLWNMLQWFFRISQSDWEIGSQVLQPLTLAKSKGPWMNVSWCVKLSYFEKEEVYGEWCSHPRSQTGKLGVCLLKTVVTEVCWWCDIGAKSVGWQHYNMSWMDGRCRIQPKSVRLGGMKGTGTWTPGMQLKRGATHEHHLTCCC